MLAVWLSHSELMQLPIEGPAWEAVAAAAALETGAPNLADQSSNADVLTLAKALVGARTGNETYISQVRSNLMSVMETENGGTTLALGRGLAPYVISADLVGLEGEQATKLHQWLQGVIHEELSGRTLTSTHEDRPNNWGTMAGASRAAVAVYLGDTAELQRTAQVFKGYLGDRSSYAGFKYGEDLSWQADPDNPVGVNPAGATKEGHSIDGVLPDDMRRGGSFQWPPQETGYPWEALQGVVVQAEILYRAGYDTWQWEDQAIRRAVQFLDGIGWHAEGDDEWTPWLIDARYHNQDPDRLDPQARHGKIMGWTSWTHAGPQGNQAPFVNAGSDQTLAMPSTFTLEGIATDDGLPSNTLMTKWSQVSGPAAVQFDNPSAVNATATFPEPGVYSLRLTADDGEFAVFDDVTITVNDSSQATTISFQDGASPGAAYAGTRDSTIKAKPGNKNLGAATTLETGGNQGSAALVKWDVSALPADGTVESAAITIDILSTAPDTYVLYALSRDWQEDQVTWKQYSTGKDWQAAGAQGDDDRSSAILGMFTATSTGPLTIELSADGIYWVQSWIDYPQTNYGLIVQPRTGTSGRIAFSSSEASNPSQRPRLTVAYAPGSATASAASQESLADVALGLLYAIEGEQTRDGSERLEAEDFTDPDWMVSDPDEPPPARGTGSELIEDESGEADLRGGPSHRASAQRDADDRTALPTAAPVDARLLAEMAKTLAGKWHGTLSTN